MFTCNLFEYPFISNTNMKVLRTGIEHNMNFLNNKLINNKYMRYNGGIR
jgi:hypothetical protein